jgi:hypothetical protein
MISYKALISNDYFDTPEAAASTSFPQGQYRSIRRIWLEATATMVAAAATAARDHGHRRSDGRHNSAERENTALWQVRSKRSNFFGRELQALVVYTTHSPIFSTETAQSLKVSKPHPASTPPPPTLAGRPAPPPRAHGPPGATRPHRGSPAGRRRRRRR